MARTLRFRHGIEIALQGAPAPIVEDGPPIGSVAILGSDLPGLRPRLEVAAGDTVRAGQTLLRDRARPDIAVTAPAAGTVAAIDLGARRSLSALVLHLPAGAPGRPGAPEPAEPPAQSDSGLRDLLLRGGLWPAFRSRPFGRIPDPDAAPAAIFVSAIDTAPLAADPALLLAGRSQAFAAGLAALAELTAGPVFVCQRPGPPLAAPVPERVEVVAVSGPHPAGLAGMQIHHLWPASADRPVWTVAAQDVADIGDRLVGGPAPARRVVALCGPLVARPRLLRTLPGANLSDLTAGALIGAGSGPDARPRILSGSVLSGHPAAYLGRQSSQVTVVPAAPMPAPWRGPALPWASRRRAAPQSMVPQPMVPLSDLDRALPADLPPVPLMRALATGDADAARRLGALGLVEEDVALLSWLTGGGTDYGALLRRTLDDMEAA